MGRGAQGASGAGAGRRVRAVLERGVALDTTGPGGGTGAGGLPGGSSSRLRADRGEESHLELQRGVDGEGEVSVGVGGGGGELGDGQAEGEGRGGGVTVLEAEVDVAQRELQVVHDLRHARQRVRRVPARRGGGRRGVGRRQQVGGGQALLLSGPRPLLARRGVLEVGVLERSGHQVHAVERERDRLAAVGEAAGSW